MLNFLKSFQRFFASFIYVVFIYCVAEEEQYLKQLAIEEDYGKRQAEKFRTEKEK